MQDGVYFSVCSDTPLFDSRDKFDSGHRLAELPTETDREGLFVGETVDSLQFRHLPAPRCIAASMARIWATCSTMARNQPASAIVSIPPRYVSMPRAEYNAWVAKNGADPRRSEVTGIMGQRFYG